MQYFPWPAAPPPPINITLQQPPTFPAWKAAIIGAVTGAVAAFCMNFILEILKPQIVRKLNKRKICRELNEEFTAIFQRVMEARKVIEDAQPLGQMLMTPMLDVVKMLLPTKSNDLYIKYFDQERSVVCEIDSEQHLKRFYRALNSLPEMLQTNNLARIDMVCWAIEAEGADYAKIYGLKIPTDRAALKKYLHVHGEAESSQTTPADET